MHQPTLHEFSTTHTCIPFNCFSTVLRSFTTIHGCPVVYRLAMANSAGDGASQLIGASCAWRHF
ncbi:hypothetical protein DEO72_LG7g1702 [Vigna unguiculata]|uniref:Uncharacterized protein n=1 Tax=Vigna unguiculata TaxID=3917 RepID=A0A4D6MIK8_VIGUN|nr:hypothetical protein DEO72_LG7g1702 [Vigna unguiculata]